MTNHDKEPIPMTMEERFLKKFAYPIPEGKYYPDTHYINHLWLPKDYLAFIRQELSLLQSAHDAKIKRLREAIEKWEREIPEEISAQWDVNLNMEAQFSFGKGIKAALAAFDHELENYEKDTR